VKGYGVVKNGGLATNGLDFRVDTFYASHASHPWFLNLHPNLDLKFLEFRANFLKWWDWVESMISLVVSSSFAVATSNFKA